MGSPLSATAPAFSHFSYNSPLFARCIHTRLFAHGRLVSPISSLSCSSRLISLRAASVPEGLHRRFECAASFTASFGTGGGGNGSGGGGDEGGEGTDNGVSESRLGATGADDLSTDVIILNVGVRFHLLYI